MSSELNHSEDLKKEIKEALDGTFGPLMLQMAKMIKEISETVKSQLSFNEIMAAKINMVFSNQTEMQSKLVELDSINTTIEKLDMNLAKFLQKSMQDMKKLEEKISSIPKQEIIVESITKKEESVPEPAISSQYVIEQKRSTPIEGNHDTEYITYMISEFSKREIYSTEALRLIEDTRDKLLFERDDEVRYRAYAAKIFREILAIAKQEKDFSTLSSSAALDIKKHLTNLLEHIRY